LETNKSGTATPSWNDLTPWIKAGTRLADNAGADTLGNSFIIGNIQSRLQVHTATKSSLSTAADNAFWGPYS